jgi:hypothetical protein
MKEVHLIEWGLGVKRVGVHEQKKPAVNDSDMNTVGDAKNESDESYRGGKHGHNQDRETIQYRPCHYFDYIGGTTTGGLLAVMLGRLRMSIEDCIEEYERLAESVFAHPRTVSLGRPIPWLRDRLSGPGLQNAIEDITRRYSPKCSSLESFNFSFPPGLCRT